MKNKEKVSLDDLTGYETITDDIRHVLKLIDKTPNSDLSISPLPAGILIYGRIGMGKTMLLNAIDQEANVPVYKLYASKMPMDDEDSIKERINNTFDGALKSPHSILLIDDLDRFMDSEDFGDATKTFKYRLVDLFEHSDNQNQTLPIASTSKVSIDQLVDRTGRFESHINLPTHGHQKRKTLIKKLIDTLGFEVDAPLDDVSRLHMNVTPAKIRYQIIMAKQIAMKRSGKSVIRLQDFIEARERSTVGLRTLETSPVPIDTWRTALHEAGHTVASYASTFKETFVQVSILPTFYSSGHTSYGVDGLIEKSDNAKTLNDLLMRFLSGAVAETIFLGSHSSGSSDDIQKATTVATQMVYEYGMSDLGFRNFTGENSYGETIPISPETKSTVDARIDDLLENAKKKSQSIIEKNKMLVEKIAKTLLENKILFKADINTIIETHGFQS